MALPGWHERQPAMRIRRPLLEASFVMRENRFRARVSLAGEEVPAHLPNSGRLSELLLPGRRVLVGEARAPHGVTEYDLLMVQLPETPVSVDARLPYRLFAEALESGTLREFAGLRIASPEFRYGESRLDFLLEADSSGESCIAEVKSVTVVRDGVGYFRDAVTRRRSRHQRESRRAAVFFVIQRGDARFSAHMTTRIRISGSCCRGWPAAEWRCTLERVVSLPKKHC